jgi:hypothetical protein
MAGRFGRKPIPSRRVCVACCTKAARVETGDYLGELPKLTLAPEGMSQASAADIAFAGVLIGPYRLIHELGVGGMGLVWLAERVDGGLKRQVASQAATPELVQRAGEYDEPGARHSREPRPSEHCTYP